MTEPKKIWANSGDAHLIEPDDLFVNRLPAELAARMPRREAVDDQTEIIHIDGESYTMKMAYRPKMTAEYVEQHGLDRSLIGTPIQARWPMQGIRDLEARLADLDKEGIWGEVVYASVGLWNGLIRSPDLYREGCPGLQRLAEGDVYRRHEPLCADRARVDLVRRRRRGRGGAGCRSRL